MLQIMWQLRGMARIHLVHKSYINEDDLRRRLRAFTSGIAFTDRLCWLWGQPGPFQPVLGGGAQSALGSTRNFL